LREGKGVDRNVKEAQFQWKTGKGLDVRKVITPFRVFLVGEGNEGGH